MKNKVGFKSHQKPRIPNIFGSKKSDFFIFSREETSANIKVRKNLSKKSKEFRQDEENRETK